MGPRPFPVPIQTLRIRNTSGRLYVHAAQNLLNRYLDPIAFISLQL